MAQIVDSYDESNQSASSAIDNTRKGVMQSFTGDGGVLDSVKFYLKKQGSPTGNAVVKIYAHSGTFGTNSIPTGAALATSGTFDISTLTTAYQLITFTFTGGDKITLTNGTKYCVALEYADGGFGDYLVVGEDSSSPSHGGNWALLTGSWGSNDNTRDVIFYVYRDSDPVVRRVIGPSIGGSQIY